MSLSFNNITLVIIFHCCWSSYCVFDLSGLIGLVHRLYPRGYTFHIYYFPPFMCTARVFALAAFKCGILFTFFYEAWRVSKLTKNATKYE